MMSVNVRPAVSIALAGTLAVSLAGSTAAAECPIYQNPPPPSTTLDFQVPPGCHVMLVKAWGNGGNAGVGEARGYGGGGAALTAAYEVQAGQAFRIWASENYGSNPTHSGFAS